MITQQQRETFESRGLLRLEGFLPAPLVFSARRVLLSAMEEQGFWRNQGWLLQDAPYSDWIQNGKRLVDGVKQTNEFIELMNVELLETISNLVADRPVFPLTRYPAVLFTLPNADTWTLPHQHWHLDLPRFSESGISGVQVFTFLEEVVPGGGGTLALTGSHRLLNDQGKLSSKQVRNLLLQHRYFKELCDGELPGRDRFLEEAGMVDDVELRVVEMHGTPGDVYLMDLRTLHAPSPNAAAVPRVMLTQRYMLESLR